MNQKLSKSLPAFLVAAVVSVPAAQAQMLNVPYSADYAFLRKAP